MTWPRNRSLSTSVKSLGLKFFQLLLALGITISLPAGEPVATDGAPSPNNNPVIPTCNWPAPASHSFVPMPSETFFKWQVEALQDGAELITLVAKVGHSVPSGEGRKLAHSKSQVQDDSVPLLSVLRDSLGDRDPKNDRLLTIWLFTDPRPTTGRRILSAVPFYYRRDDDANAPTKARLTRLSDLTQPENHVISSVGHDLLQRLAFDGLSTPVRASSRTYRTNEIDARRLYLEEALTFLRRARDSVAPNPLTAAEMNLLIGRLCVSKQSFGGLTGDRSLEEGVEQENMTRKRAEERNWEILRQAAEKTGLIFEPIRVAGIAGEFAMLWKAIDVPGSTDPPAADSPATASIVKLLTISNPAKAGLRKHDNGHEEFRSFSASGALLPLGAPGESEHRLLLLALYSLDYDRVPLLLIDFQDPTRAKRREISQRAVKDVVHGVLGLSLMTNWYYFAGYAVFEFIQRRHGSALNQGSRLDCYARLRAALMLDHDLDSDFRAYVCDRLSRMAINPLEVAPAWELEIAGLNYQQLKINLAKPSFRESLGCQRRAEMAEDIETGKQRMSASLEHAVTLGLYTRRAPKTQFRLIELDEERRIKVNLAILETATRNSTDPEIAYGEAIIANALTELTNLTDANTPPAGQQRIKLVLERLNASSRNRTLLARSARLEQALDSIHGRKRSDAVMAIRQMPNTSGWIRKCQPLKFRIRPLLHSARPCETFGIGDSPAL
jgi:hypothetical protein